MKLTRTTLQKADENVPFSDLQNGQRVSVSVAREGDVLRPVSVRILE